MRSTECLEGDAMERRVCRTTRRLKLRYKAHFNAAERWEKLSWWTSTFAAILTGGAGTTVVASNNPQTTTMAGAVALVGAALAAFTAATKPGDRAAGHRQAGIKSEIICDEFRLLRDFDLPKMTDPEAKRAAVRKLFETMWAHDEAAPLIPNWAYEQACIQLEKEEAEEEAAKLEHEKRKGSNALPPPGTA